MGIFDKIKEVVGKKEESYPKIPSGFPMPGAEKKPAEGLPPTPMAPGEPLRTELPPAEEPTFGLPAEPYPAFPPTEAPPVFPPSEAPAPGERPPAPFGTHAEAPPSFPATPSPLARPAEPAPAPPEELKALTKIPSSAFFEIIKGKLDTIQAKIEKIEHQLDIVLSLQKTQTSGKYL